VLAAAPDPVERPIRAEEAPCVTIRNLRNARIVWAWLHGQIEEPADLDE